MDRTLQFSVTSKWTLQQRLDCSGLPIFCFLRPWPTGECSRRSRRNARGHGGGGSGARGRRDGYYSVPPSLRPARATRRSRRLGDAFASARSSSEKRPVVRAVIGGLAFIGQNVAFRGRSSSGDAARKTGRGRRLSAGARSASARYTLARATPNFFATAEIVAPVLTIVVMSAAFNEALGLRPSLPPWPCGCPRPAAQHDLALKPARAARRRPRSGQN